MKNEQFKILTPREHVRLRTGMYLGSVSSDTVDRLVMGKWGSFTYVPAIFKMINEIIDNSLDEAIRSDFKFANKIDVSVSGETITVTDNGRGIPQHEVTDSASSAKILQPVAAWTRTNAGTSFTDDRVTVGANGVGSAATNFLSRRFCGTTWRDGTAVIVKCENGAEKISISAEKKRGSGTIVSFEPDFSFFESDSIHDHSLLSLVEDRLMSLQLAFPEIVFSYNGEKIKTTDIKKYAELFTAEAASAVIEKSDDLSFFFVASEDGFRTNSFVNGVNTYQGGTYVDYIVNGVIDELLVMIKKRHKIEVTKSTIKGGLTFVLFARNFVNSKFDSQTKERLTNSLGEVKSHYERAGVKDFKFIAKKLFAADDIIEPIIAAQIAKKEQQDRRDALQGQKKLKKIRVAKHVSASTKQAALSLCEGDSATGFFLSVRDPKKHGIYPLRGVVMNTWDLKPVDVLKNKELSEVISILGLNINDPDDLSGLTYDEIWTLADADVDGNKISTLLIGFFYKFWPKLFEQKRVSMLKTPIMIAMKKGSADKWFYTYEESEEFKQSETSKGWEIRYIKGLGLLTETEYAKILQKPVLYNISIDDAQLFQMMFGNDADSRKEFMMS